MYIRPTKIILTIEDLRKPFHLQKSLEVIIFIENGLLSIKCPQVGVLQWVFYVPIIVTYGRNSLKICQTIERLQKVCYIKDLLYKIIILKIFYKVSHKVSCLRGSTRGSRNRIFLQCLEKAIENHQSFFYPQKTFRKAFSSEEPQDLKKTF